MLTLPIKKKWFCLILKGIKKEEYRDIKPYYTSRFSKLFGISEQTLLYYANQNYNVEFENSCAYIIFRNGYSKKSPCFKVYCRLAIKTGNPEWGAEPNKKYYVLKILEIKEVKENGKINN